MKISLSILLLLLLSCNKVIINQEKIICPICKQLNIKSIVYPLNVICTSMYCGTGYYDSTGVFIQPEKCNTCKHYFKCSNGHDFIIHKKSY